MSWETELVESAVGSFHSVRGDLVTWRLRRFGAHQRNELAMVLSLLRPGDRVIDVGAHIGTFAVPFAGKVGESGRVDAFEGLAEHHELLVKNVALNRRQPTVCPHLAIVTDRPGRFAPQVRPDNSAETWFTRRRDAPAQTPPVVLDDWWRQGGEARIDLLKIDVEGMELDVLRGCRELIAACRPILYVEIHRFHLARRGIASAEIDGFLRSFGYHFFRNLSVRNSRHDAFKLGRLAHLEQGGTFFDVLAIDPASERYPASFRSPWASVLTLRLRELVRHALRLPPLPSLRRALARRVGNGPPTRGCGSLDGDRWQANDSL